MYFTQYIAPSLLLAGSAVASNVKRSDHAYDSADSKSYDASYEYADKSGEEYAAPAEYGDEYAAPAEYGDDYAAPAEYGDDYAWSSTWDAYAEPTGQWKEDDYIDDYDYDYDYSDKKGTTWVTDVDAAEPTGDWVKDEDCDDDIIVEEECYDDVDDSMVQIIKVSDNDGNLVFSPNDIKAPVGSYVQFHFWPKNHSIVQSDFANPCVPINNIMPEVTGMFSGFMPVSPDSEETPVFTYKVADEKPVWFYCSQGMHCQSGMGGVINAPASGDKTVDMYIEAAKNAPENLSPDYSMHGGVSGDDTGAYCSSKAHGSDGTAVWTSAYYSSTWMALPTGGATLTTSATLSIPTGSSNASATEDEPLQATAAAPGSLVQSAMGGFTGLAIAAVAAVLAL